MRLLLKDMLDSEAHRRRGSSIRGDKASTFSSTTKPFVNPGAQTQNSALIRNTADMTLGPCVCV